MKKNVLVDELGFHLDATIDSKSFEAHAATPQLIAAEHLSSSISSLHHGIAQRLIILPKSRSMSTPRQAPVRVLADSEEARRQETGRAHLVAHVGAAEVFHVVRGTWRADVDDTEATVGAAHHLSKQAVLVLPPNAVSLNVMKSHSRPYARIPHLVFLSRTRTALPL